MSAARRLANLERSAPRPAPVVDPHDADSAARILAMATGDPLPTGAAPSELERRAAKILAIMAAAPMVDDDGGQDGGS